ATAYHHGTGETSDEVRMLAAMSKLYASETSKRAADQAVQIHGGYGFMQDYPVARYWRDVKVNEIGEGTSEVQRMLIARLLGLEAGLAIYAVVPDAVQAAIREVGHAVVLGADMNPADDLAGL